MNELDAVVFNDPRRLRFGFDHLNNHGHHLTETEAGGSSADCVTSPRLELEAIVQLRAQNPRG